MANSHDKGSSPQASLSDDVSDGNALRQLVDGYLDFTAAVVAARGPVLAGLFFWFAVALPDQSVEAVRIILAWPWYGALTAMSAWVALCGYLSFTLIGFAQPALLKISGGPRPLSHRILLSLLYVMPPLAALMALEPVNTLYSIFGYETDIYYDNLTIRAIFLIYFAGNLLRPLTSSRMSIFTRFKDNEFGTFTEILVEYLVRIIVTILSIISIVWFSIVGYIQSLYGVFLEIPSVLFLTILATILVLVLSKVAQFAERTRMPIFTMALLWVVVWSCTDLSDNHEIRYIQSLPRNTAMPADKAFRSWLDARTNDPNRQPFYPVFLVAAEGGGARAAYFTALVLEELRARCPHFLRHTFLLVGVSGGSLGATLAAASAAAEADRKAEDSASLQLACRYERGKELGSGALDALSWDFLSPLLRGALIYDLLARLMPTDLLVPDVIRRSFINATDRARYLERAVERAWHAETGRELGEYTFQSLWHGPLGNVPALMLLTTNVETGHRMAVSHLAIPRIRSAQIAGAGERANTPTASDQEARLRTLSELTGGLDLPLATAALLSARFPLVTPAGTLPGARPKHRYVDGGYFENSGLTTVLELVDVLRRAVRDKEVRLVILRIENSRATTNAMTAAGVVRHDSGSSFAELASPIRALLATRQARGEQAQAEVARVIRDAEAACLSRASGSAPTCAPIEEIVFALEPSCVPIPLGWSLTQSARDEMQDQLLGAPSRQCHSEGSQAGRNAQSLKHVIQLVGARDGAAQAKSP